MQPDPWQGQTPSHKQSESQAAGQGDFWAGQQAQPQPQTQVFSTDMNQQAQPQQAYAQPAQQYAQQGANMGAPALWGQPTAGGQTIMAGTGMPQTNAMLALILALVSIFAGGLCLAIPAAILAKGALNITDAHPGHPDASNAKIAWIISLIIIGLSALALIVVLGMFSIGAMGAAGGM